MVNTPAAWLRLVAGLGVVFALFQWIASALHSDRGQAGAAVAVLVVGATIAADIALFGERWGTAPRAIGLGWPETRGLMTAAAVCVALMLVVPVYSLISGSDLALTNGWFGAIPGLFAQAGIAEEALFRGWLFGRVRRGRSFWSAAWLSMLPFVAVHLFLFLTMPIPVALAAVLLAVVVSFPLAHLYELGGATIWPPALLHFVIQGTVKLVSTDDNGVAFPIAWMFASAAIPQFAFLVKRPVSIPASR